MFFLHISVSPLSNILHVIRSDHNVFLSLHTKRDVLLAVLPGAVASLVDAATASVSRNFPRIQSAHSLFVFWSQMKTTDPVQASCWNQTNVHSPLCVFQPGDVVYGDRSGATVCAELLHMVFLHAAQLSPGEIKAVLKGWVGVGHAAGHGGNPHVIQRHVVLACRLPHLMTRLGTAAGSQDPRYMSPPGDK